jgi:signal transduction histidine kinase
MLLINVPALILRPGQVVLTTTMALEAARFQGTIRRLEGVLLTGGSIGVCLLILLVFLLASRKSGIVAQALNTMATSVERSRDEAKGPAEIVVEERSRMAQELHDTIVQGLIAVIVQLQTAEGILGDHAPPDALRRIAIARHVAQDSLIEARRSVLNLLPTPLAEGGLNYALASLKSGLEADGIAYTMELEPGNHVPIAVEKELFRTAQEALANVRKHSGAHHVLVKLSREGERVVLIVADDGRGFDPTALNGPGPAGRFGLWSIRSRLASIGGSVAIESSPGAGTTITAEVPGRL